MPSRVDSVLDALVGRLLPPRCVLCEAPGQRPVLDLCADCEADLPRQGRVCPRCALPVPAGTGPADCGRCRIEPPPWDRCHVPWRYEFPLDGLVQELKYAGRLPTGRVLGTLLGRSVVAAGLHRDVDLIVPVPLHPARLAERGFNQSLEIARALARVTQRPLAADGLRRTRATRAQVGLPLRERRANLLGAFAAARGLGGLGLAVVDDVMTSGSTLREIAGALRRAGAGRIDVWCVARALRDAGTLGPDPEDPAAA